MDQLAGDDQSNVVELFMLHAITIFISAFLLFLVQPIIAKAILPWFGGSAAVWTTCMLFFQSVLLAGYAYADFTTRHLNPRRQALLHIGLLAASLLLLPILPNVGWKPLGDEDPVSRILLLLTVTLGLPYFLLSTTGPLVQSWFAREQRAGSVYRLFALSNFASLLALVAYPVVIEPFVAGRVQAWGWSLGYVLFVLVCAAGAWRAQRYTMPEEPSGTGGNALRSNHCSTVGFSSLPLAMRSGRLAPPLEKSKLPSLGVNGGPV